MAARATPAVAPAAAYASDLRGIVAGLEARAVPPPGQDESFAGWGVMGLPFSSGHYLALRRFPASSIGPAYSAVWWRDPDRLWTMFTSVAADQSCPRYFGRALAAQLTRDIDLHWSGPDTLRVRIADVLDWQMTIGSSFATRMMSTMGAAMPTFLWRNAFNLGMIGHVAPLMLRAGHVRLQGHVPNGQWFQANPRRLWLLTSSRAVLRGEDFGTPRPLPAQAQLGDLWLPQQGMFFVGEAYLERLDPNRHGMVAASTAHERGM